jgi:hypothetical protein
MTGFCEHGGEHTLWLYKDRYHFDHRSNYEFFSHTPYYLISDVNILYVEFGGNSYFFFSSVKQLFF